MGAEYMENLEKELNAPLDAPVYVAGDVDKSAIRRGIGYLADSVYRVGDYFKSRFGRYLRPRARRYVIANLDPRVGGAYTPEDRTVVLNADTLTRHPELAEEAADHENVHDVQRESIKAYAQSLYQKYGPIGMLLGMPIIEGIASYFTSKIRGYSRDSYGQFRTGAEQMARDHGEYSLLDSGYINRNIGNMVYSFIKGASRYSTS